MIACTMAALPLHQTLETVTLVYALVQHPGGNLLALHVFLVQ